MQNGVVGRLLVEISADMDNLQSGLQKAKKESEQTQNTIQNGWSKAADKMNSVGNKMTLGVTAPLIAGGIAAIKYASDLQETQQKIDVVFGESAEVVKDWASTAVEQMGLAKETAMSAASTYGNMADGMGLASDTGLEMAMSLTQLSADLASFNNTSQETARIALNSVFTGETETLKQYGIVMTQTNLQQYAMSQGITKNIQSMTQAEQVQLRYNYVLASTTNAQGDFARTSDSVANQTRMAKEQFKEAAAMLGENLLPAASKVLSGVNGLLKGFNSLDKDTQSLIITLGGIAIAAGPVLKISSGMIATIQKLRKGISDLKLAKQAKDITDTAKAVADAGKATKQTSSLVGEFGQQLTYTKGAAQGVGDTMPIVGNGAKTASSGVKSFGAAISSSLGPITLAITAVTALAGVYVKVTEASEEYQKSADSAKTFRASTEEMTQSAMDNLAAMKAQEEQVPALISRLYELNDAETLSSVEKSELTNIVTRLNTQYEGLGLAIDSNTGKLNMNKDQLETNKDAIYKNVEALAKQEAYYDAVKTQIDAENNKAAALKKVRDAIANMVPYQRKYLEGLSDEELLTVANTDGIYNMGSALYVTNGDVRDGFAALRDYAASAEDAGEMVDYLTGSTDDETRASWANTSATKEGTEATAEMTEKVKELTEAEAAALMARKENNETLSQEEQTALDLWKSNNEERAKVLEESVKREMELQNARVEAATDANDRIKLSDQTSLVDAAKNIEENTKVVEQYTADLDYLYGKIPDTVHTYLKEAGVDQARIVSEMRKNMETGGGEIAQRFVDAYLAALQAGKSPAEAEAIALGDTTDAGVGKGLDNGQAATNAAEAEIKDIKGTMQSAIGVAGFETDGMNIASAIARGLSRARSQIYDVVDQITDTIKAKFSINVTATATGSGASVKAYDVGGYFTKPQFIQIAEKRPEFVGAADDLESFVSKAVNNAFVGVNPAVLQAVPLPQVTNNQSGDTINFNPQITFHAQKITDAEMKRATQYIKREFAKVTGGRMS